ncbi:MAG: hypothetical protein GTO14_08485 [Anaerolineales bacterium]|nr:hypothetical protein [Anaerolineales bacterium]
MSALAFMMRTLTLKSSMFTRILFLVLTMWIPVLTGGCHEDDSPSTSEAPYTPPFVTPTEASPSVTEQSTISVPQGEPLAIDGTLHPGEWDRAVIETFSDGSELLLMYSEGYLYLGIRANTSEMIVGNVLIDYGEEIAILHSSAALGTGVYRKEMGRWELIQDFVWRCRNRTNSESAQEERNAFLQDEHWMATNSYIGTPNEVEYQIEMTSETLRIAVNYINASGPYIKIPWPIGLDDDSIKPVPGGLPQELHFSPSEWALIRIESSDM